MDEFRKFLINTSSTEIADLIITCVDWCTCSPTTADDLNETVCKMLDDHFSHPNKPSYHSSIRHLWLILDLVLTNHESLI